MFFFRKFWDLIKEDIIELLHEIWNGQAKLERINFYQIVLIPKREDPKGIGYYRTIALLNSSLKITSKVLTNRLTPFIG